MTSKRKKGSAKKKNSVNKKNISELNKSTLEKKDKKTDNTKKDLTKEQLKKEEKVNDVKDSNKENVENKVADIQENKNEEIQNKVDSEQENTKIKDTKIDDINNTDKKDENKQIIKEEQKILSTENVQKEKKKLYNIFFILFFVILITIFSTVFALLNMNNSNMIKGLKIKNIDVSGLTTEEAKEKVEKALSIELMQDLNMKYEDKYEINFSSEQIEFSYNIEDAINKAYKIGRSGNIILDNYTLLYTMFFKNNVNIDYTYNEEFLNDFIEDAESKIPGVVTQVSYYIEENQLIINKGIDGIGIDKEKLKKNILENIQTRSVEEIINNKKQEQIQIPIINKKADSINIEKIYEDIYTEPKDAYYELEPFNIYPEVNGIDLEITLEEAKKQIETEKKDEYRFNLKITPPEKTIKSFGIEAFPQLISSFSTKYIASNINRSKNLEIAAGKINGLVLMPGEVFSFNKVVGKRTVEEGYRDAKIYQDGAVVDGLAGGICQISSTLYNSVLLANLEIVERRNHSFTTSYVPAGRDATVVYGTTDFQFKNSRTYPIKIEAIVSGGVATFNIHSVSLEENEYEVKITPIITQSIPYTTEQILDPTLLPGEQVVQQAGQPGYRVTTYKELKQNGKTISKDIISNDLYRPMRNIIRIGL